METIENIVREMRVMARVSDNGYCAQFCAEYADRIEEAAMNTITTDNTETLHNALDEIAKLREALDEAAKAYCAECYKASGDWCDFDDDESNCLRACPKIREWKALVDGRVS